MKTGCIPQYLRQESLGLEPPDHSDRVKEMLKDDSSLPNPPALVSPVKRKMPPGLLRKSSRWRNNTINSRHQSEISRTQRLRKSSLAHRIEKATTRVKTTMNTNRLWGVGMALIFSLSFVNGMVYIFNEFVIYAHYPNANTKKYFDILGNPYEDIAKDTVPFIQDWYREFQHKNKPMLHFPTTHSRRDEVAVRGNVFKSDDCLGRWFDDMQYGLANGGGETMTSPDVIERVLQSMDLSEQPLIRAHLDDLLTKPQSLGWLFETAYQCLSSSQDIMELACTAEKVYPNRLNNTTPQESSYVLDTLHKAVTMERLTKLLMNDFISLHQVADTMEQGQFLEFKKYIQMEYSDKPALAEFNLAKYRGIAFTLRELASAISQNQQRETSGRQLMQLNILEAVKVDILSEHEENARIGLALAAAISFGPDVKDHQYTWRLGNDWVNAYIAWNLAYVTGSVPLAFLSKLLIPVVSCTLNSEEGMNFTESRIISLALAIMQIQKPLFSGIDIDSPNEVTAMENFYSIQNEVTPKNMVLASALGQTNFHRLALPVRSIDTVEKMLYELCAERCRLGSWKGADSNPVTSLNDEKFDVYLGYVLWITVLFAGLGLELLVLLSFLQNGWSSKLEARWRLAQFIFPLLAAATLGLALMHNYLALIFLVPGLWKFGFPETIMYLYSSLYKSTGATRLQRIIELLNGVGTVVHHGAASLLIVMLLSGAVKPAQSIVNPILILLMQHWFVLMKYVSTFLYTVLELALEVWFEWIVIAELEEIFANHWTAALSANCMLVAHWLYLFSATLDLFRSHCLEKDESDFRSDKTRQKYLNTLFSSKETDSERSMRTIFLAPKTEDIEGPLP